MIGIFACYTLNLSANDTTDCHQAMKRGDMVTAIKLADSALKQAQNDFETLVCKGRAQSGLEEFDAAIVSFEIAKNATQDFFQQAVTMALIGGAQKNKNQLDAALTTYQQLLILSQKHHIKRYERIAHNRIGEIELKQNHLEAALSDFQSGDKLAANNNEHADNYAQIATVYRAMGKYTQAIEYQMKAKLTQDQFGDLESQANAMLMLGQLYTEAKQYTQAQETLTKLLKFSQDNGGEYYEAMALIHIFALKMQMNEQVEALNQLDAAQKINKKLQSEELRLEIDRLSKQVKS